MKLIVFLTVLILFSCATVSTSNGGPQPCVAKLMPCLSFLCSPEIPPTATCCIPLQSALVDDVSCLCSLFEDEGLISSFGIKLQDLVGLPPRCGLESPDLNKCDRSIPPDPSHLHPPPPVDEPPKGITPTPSSSSALGASILQRAFPVVLAAFWIITSL